jgi:D-alanyl-D-alanine carboxypeptidase/D-alanyl-D-alanine-endopeptidase (penicillin-binding protein 4)
MFTFININIRKIQFLKGLSSVVLCTLIITILFCLKSLAEDGGKSSDNNLKNLIQNGGYIIIKDDRLILAHNPDTKFIPASTWKVVTALAILENLGKNYRFTTEFYSDNQNNLYLKGFGDPFLISEEIAIILNQIRAHHLYEINNIYLDDSSFDVSTPPVGAAKSLSPYDVINGALAVNFNTINFVVSPDGKIQSAEDQTPTLPIMVELGGKLSVGTHRINVSQNPENVLRYVGELFRALQERHNIPGSGKIIPKKVPADLEPFYIHHSSKALTDVTEALMLYSNNYITNQLYLTMGALDFGYPATWEKAKHSLQNYVSNTFPAYKKEIIVDEGSGLSRNNRITPRALLAALEKFKPYAHLLPLDKGRRIKSGTLKNVYSYVGYFRNNGKYDSFVIILNQPRNHRDKILDLLEQIYRQVP